MNGPVQPVAGGVEIVVWVVPGARRSEIVGLHGDALRVRVAQPPEGGRANHAVVKLIGDALQAPTELVSGGRRRRKRLFAADIGVDDARRRLEL